jgi:ubiquitin carboxyl-terminal hydrolase 14
MGMVKLTIKWNKQTFEVDLDQSDTVDTFQTQIYTLTNVPPERQKILGIPGGPLKPADDLSKRTIKEGTKVTLIGTAEGAEIQAPKEQTKFVEDMTKAELAAARGEKVKGPLPVGLENLGNTCYMNSVVQMLRRVPELETALAAQPASSGSVTPDVRVANELGTLMKEMKGSVGSVQPVRLLFALHAKCPEFARRDARGSFAQQDAEECIRAFLTCLGNGTPEQEGSTNAVERLFGFQVQETYTCAEAPEETPDVKLTAQNTLLCHFGTSTEPVSHIHQGIQMSLKDGEMIERTSDTLGRTAQYKKVGALASIPEYFLVQFARFGWKAASTVAGTEASRVKIGRTLQFPKRLDVYEFASEELQKKLQVGRIKDSEQRDREVELYQQALKAGENEAKFDPELYTEESIDTGNYDLVSVVSHSGRTADGGHYVSWALAERADGKKVKEDSWVLFDDDKVAEKVDREVDLTGGRLDAQMAYFVLYKRSPTLIREPKTKAAETAEAPAAEAAAEAPMDVDKA